MTRFQSRGSASMALVMALALTQFVLAQESRTVTTPGPLPSSTQDSAAQSYKIYSLNDFGSDPGLCEWIAKTIPEVIAVGNWNSPATISYYAPKNILVVSHTSTVQAQVETFLKNVKKSLPETTKARASAPKSHTSGNEVVPAAYHEPGLRKAAKPTSQPTPSYPVPAQAKPPKHLFHFIIRYEGEGIVDDNIVKAMKDYYRVMQQAGQMTTAPAPTPDTPSAPSPPTPEPSSDEPPLASFKPPVKPAPSKPPAREKEDKKDDKSPEEERQAR